MWCPSCIQFYDEVLQAELPFPKRHTAEFLADRLERGEFTFTRRVEATVALHYHRASEPRRREGMAARRLLEAVPGITVVELRARRALGPDAARPRSRSSSAPTCGGRWRWTTSTARGRRGPRTWPGSITAATAISAGSRPSARSSSSTT